MPLDIRRARPDERDLVLRFYEGVGYTGEVSNDAVVFVAEIGGEIVGLLRLESEFGVTVLRGVRIRREHQRQGIGTKLLRAVANHLAIDPCYCVPYSHLTGFYGHIGFAELPMNGEALRNRAMPHAEFEIGTHSPCAEPRDDP